MCHYLNFITAALPVYLAANVEIIHSYASDTSQAMQQSFQSFLKSKKLDATKPKDDEAEFALIEKFTEEQVSRFRPQIEGTDRYHEWRPYNENKVTLSNGTEVSASRIEFANPKADDAHFIASQAPTKDNSDLFWQMVVENKSEQIVMLTELSEYDDKEQVDEELCHPYWPQKVSEKLRASNGIEVTLVEQSTLLPELTDCIEIRKFKVSCKGQDSFVTHYWYRNWGDGKAPSQTETIQKLISKVAEDKKATGSTSPIVTHCAAGVGRTGVFCACYHRYQKLQQNVPVDLFTLVGHLRWQRHEMVGELEQYQFCEKVQKSFQK